MKTLLTYKGIKYLCVAAALPTTAVVTHRSHKQINRVVERVHPKPARKYVAEAREPIPTPDLPIAPVAAITAAECVPGGGGFAGGGGSGGFIGVGGGAIGGVGALPPVGTPVTVSPVPEPSKWALMIFGFGGIGGVMRRRKL
jgi:hypothetical protein